MESEKSLDESLEKLSVVSADPAVADELINQKSLADIVSLIESGQFANMSLESAYLLTTFWNLMDGCQRSWDEVSEKLIHEVPIAHFFFLQ